MTRTTTEKWLIWNTNQQWAHSRILIDPKLPLEEKIQIWDRKWIFRQPPNETIKFKRDSKREHSMIIFTGLLLIVIIQFYNQFIEVKVDTENITKFDPKLIRKSPLVSRGQSEEIHSFAHRYELITNPAFAKTTKKLDSVASATPVSSFTTDQTTKWDGKSNENLTKVINWTDITN